MPRVRMPFQKLQHATKCAVCTGLVVPLRAVALLPARARDSAWMIQSKSVTGSFAMKCCKNKVLSLLLLNVFALQRVNSLALQRAAVLQMGGPAWQRNAVTCIRICGLNSRTQNALHSIAVPSCVTRKPLQHRDAASSCTHLLLRCPTCMYSALLAHRPSRQPLGTLAF